MKSPIRITVTTPPRVPPTVFGPFGSKRLEAYTKAEGDTPTSETPKQPKQPPTPPPPEESVASEETASPVPVTPLPPQPTKVVPASELEKPEEEDPGEDISSEIESEIDTPEEERSQQETVPTTSLPNLPQGSQGFLEAMKDDPSDNTPRLIFADFLEESGSSANADLAEFIRLQVRFPTGRSHPRIPIKKSDLHAYQAFDRMDELENSHPEWFAPWGIYDSAPETEYENDVSGAEFRRGMLTVIYSAGSFPAAVERGGGSEESLALVDTVRLLGSNPDIRQVIGNNIAQGNKDPWLPHISRLVLSNIPSLTYIADTITQVLSHQGHNLRELYLSRSYIGSETHGALLMRLCDSPNLNNLLTLDLSNNNISEANIVSLIEASQLQNLRRLILRGNPISSQRRYELEQRFGKNVVLFD